MNFPDVLLFTAVLAFMPISELRGAIPFAIANSIPWYWAFLFAVTLNALVAPVCWIFLATVHKLFYGTSPEKGFIWYKNFFDRFVENARKKLLSSVEKWGWLGIAFFVAIPLPMTGAWTGTLGAWILGINKRRTMAAVILGVFIAGVIVTVVVTLGIEALNFFLKKI
ncbi:MAG: small multi-drug export protein [Treponema sp.]|nr:small multi-drug export protein [Treponema sp.]